MGKTKKEFVKGEKRNRWVVLSAFSVLAWSAGWYCRGGNQGLFIVTCVLAGAAFLLPRTLPAVTRWVVWTWVGITVILFAANVARLIPPENNVYYYDHIMDRLITAFFAVGVSTLFFKLEGAGVSTILVSVLPMIMLVLSRAEVGDKLVSGTWSILMIGFLVLATTFDQLSQLLRPTAYDQRPIPFWREIGLRYGLLGLMLVIGLGLRSPVEQSIVFVQKQMLGLVTRSLRTNNRGGDLSLTQRLPKNFDTRMRLVMLIQGSEAPGYLREVVYMTYSSGRLVLPKQVHELIPSPNASGPGRRITYPLVPSSGLDEMPKNIWRFEVHAPLLLQGFCLPGHAQALTCEGRDYMTDHNGMVTSDNILPARYDVAVPVGQVATHAFPLPEAGTNLAYLALPPRLSGSISNWVASCDGLLATTHAVDAGKVLERYFHNSFTYRLDVNLTGSSDPLIPFMEKREGFCVHFASAAALMLRARGVPARVVAGFASFGYDPWLKRWTVREREAHSWVELWDGEQKQWLIIDPTPPAGQPSAYGGAHWLRRLLDRALTGWSRLLVWLKTANFLVLIADAGLWCFDLCYHLIRTPLGWGCMVVACGWMGWRRWRRQLRLTPHERYRLQLVREMHKRMKKSVPAALRRRESESWDTWLQRVEGKIPQDAYQELRVCVEAYQCLRYRTLLP
jgi:hypothetical protein